MPKQPPLIALPRREEVLPSFAQERMWFQSVVEPGSSGLHVALGLRLRGRLDATALEWAFTEVLRRHEVLRTTFTTTTTGLIGRVQPVVERPLRRVDLRSLPASTRLDAVREHALEERAAPFDLAAGPLARGRLLRLDEDDHALLWTTHHIACDGWSVGVLMAEVAALYGAFLRGQPSPLAELPIQYADYAAWERERMSGDRLRRELDWWTGQLRGAPRAMRVPSDGRSTATGPSPTAHQRVPLGRGVLPALADLGRRHGATLYATLASLLDVWLSRTTGQDDIVLGSVTANRAHPAAQSLIGSFVNTLVLRADLSGRPSFGEVLRRVRSSAFAAYAHSGLPFERLVEELRPERVLGANPLFDVMFINVHTKHGSFEMPGLASEWLSHGIASPPVDLTFELFELDDAADGWALVLAHRTAVFGADTACRMARHLATLIDGALAAPDAPIAALTMLAPADHAELARCGKPGPTVPFDRCVHELIAEQANRHPDRIAVTRGESALTYRALLQRSRALAARLGALGVGPDTLVAVLLERGLDLPVAWLGVLQSGAAYLPLDPTQPAERLAFMLRDSGARVLLTSSELATTLPLAAAVVVHLDGPEVGATDVPPRPSPTGEALAYVIYTSGTTGVPKGVAVHHRALANVLGAMRQAPGLAADDVLAAVTSVSFDIAALEIFLPLCAGGQLAIVPQEQVTDARTISALGATVLQATPTLWRALVDGGLRDARLRAWTGGEALPQRLGEELVARMGGVWDLYGPTETTIWSTVRAVDMGGAACVGHPIASTTVHVLDDELQPLPIGVPGEVWIGGVGVARGYLGQPKLTADRFRPDPWSADSGARMYRTGDRGRWLATGELQLHGRADDQVKIRGYRIEAAEIEVLLEQHAQVAAAAVVATAPSAADAADAAKDAQRSLVAYLVARGEVPEPAILRAHLRARVPEAMVPSAFIWLPELPRSSSGKVDRRALAARPVERAPSGLTIEMAPRTVEEATVAEIWAEVLGRPVGLNEDFFDAGGHSLLAIRLLARIAERFGKSLPLVALFQAGTIADMSDLLAGTTAGDLGGRSG